eukprot:TRINITY_DN5997_c0_g1_i1.p2 TRINITY_DN5997_c0_g1~~TRINITY_DN5997_c0_g1_i1.p2  ORF type:complete len:283 (-),score=-6.03 TRINITY_DN5997_c0_g1_i1:34-882(-)
MSSFHVQHVWKGWVRGQLIRFMRNCSEKSVFFNSHTLFLLNYSSEATPQHSQKKFSQVRYENKNLCNKKVFENRGYIRPPTPPPQNQQAPNPKICYFQVKNQPNLNTFIRAFKRCVNTPEFRVIPCITDHKKLGFLYICISLSRKRWVGCRIVNSEQLGRVLCASQFERYDEWNTYLKLFTCITCFFLIFKLGAVKFFGVGYIERIKCLFRLQEQQLLQAILQIRGIYQNFLTRFFTIFSVFSLQTLTFHYHLPPIELLNMLENYKDNLLDYGYQNLCIMKV